MRHNKKAFTLVELIVVMVVIGILASIAAPMMGAMKVKAICAEGVAALGTLRTAMTSYYIENGNWPTIGNWLSKLSASEFSTYFPGIGNVNALHGLYLGKECYYADMDPEFGIYQIAVYMRPDDSGGENNTAPKAAEAAQCRDAPGGNLYIDVRTGLIRHLDVKRSGYPGLP